MSIYQFKTTVKHISPPIWRRFLVSSNTKMSNLHKIIQTIMGWTNYHLHQFIINKEIYAPIYEDIEPLSIDYKKNLIKELINKEGQKFSYEYDFGDGWELEIILEKILPEIKKYKLPVCLDGKRSAPLEDCGGIPGYEELLEALKDPDYSKYEEILEWLGPLAFEPELFEMDKVNSLLKKKDYGCFEPD